MGGAPFGGVSWGMGRGVSGAISNYSKTYEEALSTFPQ